MLPHLFPGNVIEVVFLVCVGLALCVVALLTYDVVMDAKDRAKFERIKRARRARELVAQAQRDYGVRK